MATIATYKSHVSRALQFYFNTTNLMFAIGRSSAWGSKDGEYSTTTLVDDKHPPYPSLDAEDIDEIIGYKRYANMYFVIPDSTSSSPIVDGVHWRKIALDSISGNDDEDNAALTAKVKSYNSRWIYLDTELEPSDFLGVTYRQVGLYSGLSLASGVSSAANTYAASSIVTGSGILECIQNRSPVTRQMDQQELIAVVLEF